MSAGEKNDRQGAGSESRGGRGHQGLDPGEKHRAGVTLVGSHSQHGAGGPQRARPHQIQEQQQAHLRMAPVLPATASRAHQGQTEGLDHWRYCQSY